MVPLLPQDDGDHLDGAAVTGGRRGRPRRITLVNQFFPPDISPTAHLTADLASHLAAGGDEVTVVTGGEGYIKDAARGHDRTEDGVDVVRLWTPALGKARIVTRLSDYLSFLIGSTLTLVRLPRQDIVISLTTPPFAVLGAVAHKLVRRRCKVVLWSMDCYPDVIERLGSRTAGGPVVHLDHAAPRARVLGVARRVLRPLVSLRRGGPVSTVLRAVNRWAFRRIDHVVALDDAMRNLLLEGYGSADRSQPRVSVIPNWEARNAFPAENAEAPWIGYTDPELDDRFVILYLGNLGYGHSVTTVIEAAGLLADQADLAWLFMGGGARWEELAGLVATTGVPDRVARRAYVPKADTPGVMAGAGCALILLADEALGVMSPSKLHANLAAGLPIVYVGPQGSNVDAAIARFGCGVSLRNGDAIGLADVIVRLRDDPSWRAELCASSRRAFEECYCDEAALPRWDEVLSQV